MDIQTRPGQLYKDSDVQKITPFLWFDDQAEEAVIFYTSLFKNAVIETFTRYSAAGAKAAGRREGTLMTISFRIEGHEFTAINGGPAFELAPTISFFVHSDQGEELERLWEKLADGGEIFMKLDQYPFSEKYGWIKDKFGVSWQLILSGRMQKISPCLMFTGQQHKKAEEAINFYISVFPNSDIIQFERYKNGEGPEGAVVHARFALLGQEFIAMDSHMDLPYNFNPAISFVVNCTTQDEIDYYWEKLSAGGYEGAQQCGWLQDKYGVSWQIVPASLAEMISDADLKKSDQVMSALLQMKKIDLKTLQEAYSGQ